MLLQEMVHIMAKVVVGMFWTMSPALDMRIDSLSVPTCRGIGVHHIDCGQYEDACVVCVPLPNVMFVQSSN